ncbi:MAG: nicotinate (nicotinamide) nucleotide adenylyltransferase [Bacteroidales bacterium]
MKTILKKTGLFFGSFNPIHAGHLAIASYMVEFSDLSELWFVVSPHNPLKEKTSLLPDHHRLALVNIAITDDPRFRVSDVEFKLPRPSYSIDTLTHLQEKYPDRQFVLVGGTDMLPSLHKWKNWEAILEYYQLYLYPRHDSDSHELTRHPSVTLVKAPRMEISSSFIRESIRQGKNMAYFLPEKVFQYIGEMHFYEK